MTYDVEFPDDEIKDHSAKVIDENIFAQADDDGHNVQILDSIVDCRKESNAANEHAMRILTKSE